MDIKFNPIREVNNNNQVGIVARIQKTMGAVFGPKVSEPELGLRVESRFASLEEKFNKVPYFLECNTLQSNLEIKGDLMGVAGVDY